MKAQRVIVCAGYGRCTVPKAPAIKNGNTERALGDSHTGSSPVLATNKQY